MRVNVSISTFLEIIAHLRRPGLSLWPPYSIRNVTVALSKPNLAPHPARERPQQE